jgi:hypothetical protein
MGNMDVPSQRGPIKCPMGTYEFGANVINEKVGAGGARRAQPSRRGAAPGLGGCCGGSSRSGSAHRAGGCHVRLCRQPGAPPPTPSPQFFLIGRITADGRLSGRAKCAAAADAPADAAAACTAAGARAHVNAAQAAASSAAAGAGRCPRLLRGSPAPTSSRCLQPPTSASPACHLARTPTHLHTHPPATTSHQPPATNTPVVLPLRRYDVMNWLTLKGQVQMSGEPGPAGAQYMVDADMTVGGCWGWAGLGWAAGRLAGCWGAGGLLGGWRAAGGLCRLAARRLVELPGCWAAGVAPGWWADPAPAPCPRL